MKFNFPPAPMTYSYKVLIVGTLLLAGGLSSLAMATETVIAQTTVAQSDNRAGVQKLEVGKVIPATIEGDQKQSFVIPIEKGEYLELIVEQKSVDAIATLVTLPDRQISEKTDLSPSSLSQSLSQSTDPNRIAAQKAEAEAGELLQQKAPLVTQVIPKQEEALKYWRLAGDRQREAMTLDKIAKLYWVRGEYPKALEYAQKALPICEAIADRECQGAAFTSLSLIYKDMGEYQKAIAFISQVPSLFPETPSLYPATLLSAGQIYEFLGERQKALDRYQLALEFWKEQGNTQKQSEILQQIAFFYFMSGEIKQSIEYLDRANKLDPEFKRDRSLVNLIYSALPTFSCSEQFAILRSLPASEPSSNPSDSSESIDTPPSNSDAIENYQQSIQKYRKQELVRGEAEFLSGLAGLIYGRLGEYPQALIAYQEELTLRKFMGDKPGEAKALESIADILNKKGKKQDAINTLNAALDIQRQLKLRPSEASTLLTLGDIYLSLGAYDASLDTYKKALSIFQDIGIRSSEITTLLNRGLVDKRLKQYPEALNFYQQAFAIAQTTGNCNDAAFSKLYISQVYLEADNSKQAIANSQEGLAIAEKLGVTENKLSTQAKFNTVLAEAQIKQGNYSEAIEYAQKAQSLAQQSRIRTVEAHSFTTLAEAYAALKQPQKAIQTYRDQLALYQTLGLQPEKSLTLYNLAKLERKEGDLTTALSSINEAIDIVENIRQDVVNPELRTSFFATKQDYYTLKIDVLMDLHQQNSSQGYDAQAFDTSERSRARTLLELLNESNANIRQGVDRNLLEQEDALKYKLAALEQRWSEAIAKNATEQKKATLQQERKDLIAQSQDIQAKIRAKSPKYAALKYPQPLTLAQVQQQLLDRDTILLQYSLGKEKSYLWVVTKDSLTTYTLPPQKDIETAARELLDAIQFDKDKAESINQSTNQLSQLILTPAADKLTKKRLLIVPDGVLNYVPFSTLSLDNKPLINQYELANLPSSSSLALIRQETQNRKPVPKALAILADPIFSTNDPRLTNSKPTPLQPKEPNLNLLALRRTASSVKKTGRAIGDNNLLDRLPGTRQEAQSILPLFPENQRIAAFDAKANFTFASAPQLSQYRIVHFATHGIFNSEAPELSGIILSLVDEKSKPINGFLRLNDIFNLNLPAELVVLSACETGLGKEIKGEGLVGLTRGFMYAGSPRVLVSLWKVDDQATAEIMTRFYKLMLKKKLPPAQALREAQLQMQAETEWKSPYYWSAFVLQGEWR